jgi:hypothetical protein
VKFSHFLRRKSPIHIQSHRVGERPRRDLARALRSGEISFTRV